MKIIYAILSFLSPLSFSSENINPLEETIQVVADSIRELQLKRGSNRTPFGILYLRPMKPTVKSHVSCGYCKKMLIETVENQHIIIKHLTLCSVKKELLRQ